jgi:hypothetical protein
VAPTEQAAQCGIERMSRLRHRHSLASMPSTDPPLARDRARGDPFPPLSWDGPWTRYLFFTGKGGVGKTTVACCVALRLAELGKDLLLVSTDPASNLDDVLGVSAGTSPAPVPGSDGLSVMNIDPEAAAAAYRDRVRSVAWPRFRRGAARCRGAAVGSVHGRGGGV